MDCIKKMRLRICNVLLEMTFSTKKKRLNYLKQGESSMCNILQRINESCFTIIDFVYHQMFCYILKLSSSLLYLIFIKMFYVLYISTVQYWKFLCEHFDLPL